MKLSKLDPPLVARCKPIDDKRGTSNTG